MKASFLFTALLFVITSLPLYATTSQDVISDEIVSENFKQYEGEFSYPALTPINIQMDNFSLIVDSGSLMRNITINLTLYSNLDTIQYTTTPTPQLYAAVIRDTIYGLPTLKCGMPINKIITDLEINGSYYDYDKYKHIVLIPLLTYFQRTECINLPDACFVLENKNGILNKVEYRQFDYSGSGIVQELLLY